MKELHNLIEFKDFNINWKPKVKNEPGLKVVEKMNYIKENYTPSNYDGRYIKLEPVENGLWVYLTPEGKEEIENVDESRFYDLIDDIRGNSEWLYHDDMGEAGFGLTNAPGFTWGYYFDDDGDITDEPYTEEGEEVSEEPDEVNESAIYWFPNYMVESFIETLKDDGKVFFDEG